MERRTIVQIPSMASLNNEGASFSSSTHRWEYDVFLSFRGEDTREGFTSHLYKALSNKGINTFFDDIDLPRGEEISEKLIQAIKNSSILVIVFSENYAESKWCLDELAEIVKCREEDQEVKIRPIFYNVDPSEIRNQKGKFGRELDEHEEKFKNNKDKVQRWRDALEKAAKAAGWHYKKGNATCKSESQFIQYIVEEISNAKSNRMSLYVAEYPVGINSRAEAIESLLDIGEVVRQQAPDILEKRSRLYCYKDSLEVLTRNKGSENIRGIMLHSPRSVKVQLHTEAFRRMENLKFLIVKNVHICKPLKFLPHSLIFLKWPNYPFHWPSEYFPEQLVAIEMPNSCIRLPKLISQERRLENLTDVNLCGLPQSIRRVNAEGCMLLDTQSPSGLLNQVIEIIGILPSRVCGTARSNKLMDPQLTNYFPSETEGAESEDGDISMDPQFSNHFPSETEDVEYEDWVNRHEITCCGTEMPKWVNHQSVDNSIFFFVGRKFPKLVVCIVAGKRFDGTVDISVDISINGYKNHEISTFFCNNTLFLFSPTQRSLQRRLNESNPTDQNLVEVSITYNTRNSIKRLGVQVDDVVEYLPTSKKQRTR
ncbi:hypothetical protein CMV_026376 [Castanea mollissima]|uniref:TIR domain-containing protein n=1 Tax=Castanea mollissima TaxID=60419 RepID=A0A8J4QHE6_9ROSI|nr:hypothetical protein CMV_026376 [Castanea mollissima]